MTIQDADFLPGTNFVLKMQAGIRDADHVLAVLSSHYEESPMAQSEWAAAFASDPNGEHRRLIGVRVQEYAPTALLSTIVYVDLVDRDEADSAERLLTAIDPNHGAPHQAMFPGAARPTSSKGATRVPPPTRNFRGRRDDLDVLSEQLLTEGNRRVGVTGLGGMGKTSLVTAWVNAHDEEFDLVIWVDASDEQRATEALRQAATRIGAASEETDPRVAVDALWDALKGVKALLVLDDCADSATAASLSGSSPASLLVTSRSDRGWASKGFRQLRLDPWTLEEGLAYLAAVAPDGGANAEEVVAALGGLPLAVAQAGAYVDSTGITFDAYLDRLHGYATPLFESQVGEEYGHTVLSAWALALDDIAETTPAAAQILDVLALVNPADLPRAVFMLGRDALPMPLAEHAADPYRLDSLIAVLLRHSLCRADGDGLSIHPVVQSVVASRIPEGTWAEQVSRVLRVLRAAMPEAIDDAGSWNRIGAHVSSAATIAIETDVFSSDLAPLATALGNMMLSNGFPHGGNAVHQVVLRYMLKHHEEASPDALATALHAAANSLNLLRVADKAAPLFAEVMKLDRLTGEHASPRGISSRIGYASALTDTGQHDEALTAISEAVTDFIASGPDAEAEHPKTAIHLYGTWGRLLVRRGEQDLAEEKLQQALAVALRAGLHGDASLTYLHLGNVARFQGRTDEAADRYDKALDFALQVSNGQDLAANVLVNRAVLAFEQGDPGASVEFAEQGLEMLDLLPEGDFTATAAMLHFVRARSGSRLPGWSIADVIAEAGPALDVLCALLPPGHTNRIQVAAFLLAIADAVQDAELRTVVLEAEPAAQREG